MLWLIGGILTFFGLSVFLEFGLAIPRSGGEKNYLERVYRHPRYLATCVFAAQMILLGFSSGNALAFGRYVLYAAGDRSPDGWPARGIAIACITFAVTLHSVLPVWGLRLGNVLGVFKVVVLVLIVFSGFAAIAGRRLVPDPHNFDNAFSVHEGDGWGGGGAYAYANALLSIVYSYKGWENANYVLGELQHPRRTLAIAAPLAVGGVTILYVLVNVAYFAAIPMDDLAKSEVLVAGLFFRNVFGASAAARSLPAFVALSNMGNVLAVSFAHARVNQELAKEGLLPFSQFWASNWPFNAPTASLFLHWLVTVIVLVAPPAGPAYNFLVNLYVRPHLRGSEHPNANQPQLHLPRCMGSRLRHSRPNLPPLQKVRELVFTMAHLPAGRSHLLLAQCLPRHRPVHPAGGQLERRRVPVLRLPDRRCRRAAARRPVLDAVDQGLAADRRLQDYSYESHW